MTRKSAPFRSNRGGRGGGTVARLRRASLDRRAIFLEAHHRAQNQLQLIITLLSLEAAAQKDPDVIAMLQDLQDRVAAVGTINQLLAGRHSETTVDFAASLRDLCQSFNDAFGKIGMVELELDAAPYPLDFDTANRAALILSELLLNAFKHAFRRGGCGRAAVRLSRDGAACVLTIRDNGSGIPLGRPRGTGTRLLATLVACNRGRIERTSSPTGTTVTIIFPSE